MYIRISENFLAFGASSSYVICALLSLLCVLSCMYYEFSCALLVLCCQVTLGPSYLKTYGGVAISVPRHSL